MSMQQYCCLQNSMHAVGEHTILETYQYGLPSPIFSFLNILSLTPLCVSLYFLLSCSRPRSMSLIHPKLILVLSSGLHVESLLSLPCHCELCSHVASAWLSLICWIIALFPLFLSVSLHHLPALSPQPLIQEKLLPLCACLYNSNLFILYNVFAAVATPKTISLPVRLQYMLRWIVWSD